MSLKRSNRRVRTAVGLLLLFPMVLAAGCGGSVGTVRLAPGEDAFGTGKERFEERNYAEAALALKQYLDASPAGGHAEEASYMLGAAYALSDQCALAEVELRHFVDLYPASNHLPEVEYRLATCFWSDARPAPYDQEKTTFARDQLTRVMALYPDSPYAGQARTLLTEVRSRLAEKELINARLYLHLHQPASTVFYADRVINDFADTQCVDEALYLRGEGYFEQHQVDQAREAWAQLVREHPASEWSDKARGRLAATGPPHP